MAAQDAGRGSRRTLAAALALQLRELRQLLSTTADLNLSAKSRSVDHHLNRRRPGHALRSVAESHKRRLPTTRRRVRRSDEVARPRAQGHKEARVRCGQRCVCLQSQRVNAAISILGNDAMLRLTSPSFRRSTDPDSLQGVTVRQAVGAVAWCSTQSHRRAPAPGAASRYTGCPFANPTDIQVGGGIRPFGHLRRTKVPPSRRDRSGVVFSCGNGRYRICI